MILSRFRLLEPLDWRFAAAAVAVGLLVRFGLIGVIDQVYDAVTLAENISVRQAYVITAVTFWVATAASLSAGWAVYHLLHKRYGPATQELANG